MQTTGEKAVSQGSIYWKHHRYTILIYVYTLFFLSVLCLRIELMLALLTELKT